MPFWFLIESVICEDMFGDSVSWMPRYLYEIVELIILPQCSNLMGSFWSCVTDVIGKECDSNFSWSARTKTKLEVWQEIVIFEMVDKLAVDTFFENLWENGKDTFRTIVVKRLTTARFVNGFTRALLSSLGKELFLRDMLTMCVSSLAITNATSF